MWKTARKADVVTAVIATLFVLAVHTGAARWQPETHRLDAFAYLWLAAAGLPLIVRRRFPLTVFLVSGVLTWAYFAAHYYALGPAFVLPTIALFVLTRVRGWVVASIAAGSLITGGWIAYLITGGPLLPDMRGVVVLVLASAVIGIGTAVQNRVAVIAANRERAAEQQQRMAEQERLRIAREVHDVVAHSLAMINVQAGVAAHVADRRPDQAKEALVNIKEASASALKDLRATVALLRGGEDRAPAPSLRQMSELIEHARATGLEVQVHGEPGELPAPVDGAAYRILQESLTNVVRHAHEPTKIDVHFGQQGLQFLLVVRDDGTGAVQPKPGHGLRGMGERAAALGGRLTASVVDGGFEIKAELPIEGAP
ncbi:Signal transduction histidine kinase [Amycolatopsis xylanica]|uniref:histidine kinase n=1 Tax=Amycolatopsis xylanica TaxID=589385 RepID=A0A1H3B3C4_9PSEU|nr:sensor histidine kinase [Amycolatopsis xylanica]SDX36295.1 Signal transduction histidine kinase [Amycolatopsis xylanica]